MSIMRGTFDWAAPEQICMQECTGAADAFSFGVVLSEIVTGDPPVNRTRRPPVYGLIFC